MSTLLVIQGPNVGVKYRLEDRTTIGRAPENTIQVADSQASRVHCEIVRRGRSYTVYDRESRNGVLVNGRQVSQKLLLRNDEIAVGSSVFLFNTDYDLKNTRFSNKLVYFSAPQDETIVAADLGQPPVGAPSQDRINGIGALQTMADLFSAAEDDFPRALQSALETLMGLLKAERGCIMLWDEVLGELQPMVAVADEEELAVSKRIVHTVFHEKQAILTSKVDIDYRYARGKTPPPGALQSVLCAPLMVQDEVIGLLHMEGLPLADFRLDDIRLLQSVANLAAGAIHQAQKRSRRASGAKTAGRAEQIIGASPRFRQVLEQVEKVAPHSSPVLLTGETGTGKELIARAIHERSPRAKYPFIALNCAAIPEGLFESELFGHERGAFTGADRTAIGKIEAAHGGTLFLDEVGEMAPSVQPKLLRFLQERVFYRVGGVKPITVDVRVMAATNRDLRQAVEAGRLREDLLYRLNVVNIELPPLRARREDIRLLADAFVRKHAWAMSKKILGITDEAMAAMENYSWPGNVRELENCIERAALLSDSGVLGLQHFSLNPASAPRTEAQPDRPAQRVLAEAGAEAAGAPRPLRELEEQAIRSALAHCRGSQSRAAELLQIHRNTLHNKIQEYGIDLSKLGG